VSVENLGPFSSSTLDFLRDLGRRISHISGDDREALFLFQGISVTIHVLTTCSAVHIDYFCSRLSVD